MKNLPPRSVLTAVSVVCRKHFSQHASLLPRLASRIDSFIDSFSSQGALVKACERGDSAQSLQYFFSREEAICWRDAVKKTAKRGFTHVLEWMAELPLDQGPWAADFEDTIDMAAKGGHLETIKWLHEHRGVEFTAKSMEKAAQNGHLDVVQWLYANCGEGIKSDAAEFAASGGHLEILEWLHSKQGATCTEFGVELAAENGHLEVLKWLSKHASQEFNSSVMDWAAMNGHLSAVQWLHENREEGCTTAAMDGAAGNGHLAVVEWLHNNRKEGCTTKAMDKASANGHLDVVKFLHANRSEGCTTSAMDQAIYGGHVDVAQWVKDNRTEGWSEYISENAMEGVAADGHLDMLKWLLTNLPNGKYSAKVMDRAAGAGHLDMVKWLHENRTEGCSTKAMDKAAANNHLEVLKWLHSNRTEGCTANAIDYAAATGNLEIAKWLHANCRKGCTLEAFTLAAKYDKVGVLKWLYRTQPREAARTPRFELAMVVNMSSVGRPCPRVVKWFYESGEPMPGIVENAAQNEGSLELIQCVVKRCPSKNTPLACSYCELRQSTKMWWSCDGCSSNLVSWTLTWCPLWWASSATLKCWRFKRRAIGWLRLRLQRAKENSTLSSSFSRGTVNESQARSGSLVRRCRLAKRMSCNGCANTSTTRIATLGLSDRSSAVPELGMKICPKDCKCCWHLAIVGDSCRWALSPTCFYGGSQRALVAME